MATGNLSGMSGTSTRHSMSFRERLISSSAATATGEEGAVGPQIRRLGLPRPCFVGIQGRARGAQVRPPDVRALDELVRLRPRLARGHVKKTGEGVGQVGGVGVEQRGAPILPAARGTN